MNAWMWTLTAILLLLFGVVVIATWAWVADRFGGSADEVLERAWGAVRFDTGIRPGGACDIAADGPIIARPDGELGDLPCVDCEAQRCWAWRDSGHVTGCGNVPESGNSYVGLEDDIANPGRHRPGEALRRWVDSSYSPLSIAVRVALAPTSWARRLPVPVSAAWAAA